VESCVEAGVGERAFQARFRYFAYCDPSGGSVDSMTVAVAHREGERVILDAVLEIRPPFSPIEAVRDIVDLLRRYRCTAVTGDAYAAAWVRDQFRLHAIAYRHAELNRSELFLQFLPLLTSGSAVLLDQPRLINQIAQLERRTGRTGRDAVDHRPGAHDDVAVAVAGALVCSNGLRGTYQDFAERHHGKDLPTRANVGFSDVKKRFAEACGLYLS
jgi:hypothetical protein